jgi:hypothetical protein
LRFNGKGFSKYHNVPYIVQMLVEEK